LYELLVGVMCIAAVAIFVKRLVISRQVMASYRLNKTKYLNVSQAAMWDEVSLSPALLSFNFGPEF